MILVPKLRVPFQIVGGRAAVVEQDSVDEIVQCVEYLLRTEPGSRYEAPEFGLPDPAFTERPDQLLSLARSVIDRWEPRAATRLSSEEIDQLTRRVLLRVGVGGSQ